MEQSLFMKWKESDKLNVPILDEELRALYSLLNSLHYFIEQGYFDMTEFKDDPFVKLYEKFMDLHFLTEEKLMERTMFPDTADHVKEHREIKKGFEGSYQKILNSGKIEDVAGGLDSFKKRWLKHMSDSDSKFALHYRSQIKSAPLYIIWNEKYDLGIPIIDEQHRGFAAYINTLHFFIREGWVDQMVSRVDKVHPFEVAIQEYIKIHFQTEETIMAASGYAELAKHQDEHKKITENIKQVSLLSRKSADSKESLNFLKSWWLTHINGEDRKFTEYYNTL